MSNVQSAGELANQVRAHLETMVQPLYERRKELLRIIELTEQDLAMLKSTLRSVNSMILKLDPETDIPRPGKKPGSSNGKVKPYRDASVEDREEIAQLRDFLLDNKTDPFMQDISAQGLIRWLRDKGYQVKHRYTAEGHMGIDRAKRYVKALHEQGDLIFVNKGHGGSLHYRLAAAILADLETDGVV